MNLQLRSRASLRTCPYCHDALRPQEAARPCDGCGTVLHTACAAEVGCTTFGCARTPSADLKDPRAPWRATAEAAAAEAAARSWARWQAQTASREERLDAVRSRMTELDPDPDGLGTFRPKVTHVLFAIGLLMAALCAFRLATTLGARAKEGPRAARLQPLDEITQPIR